MQGPRQIWYDYLIGLNWIWFDLIIDYITVIWIWILEAVEEAAAFASSTGAMERDFEDPLDAISESSRSLEVTSAQLDSQLDGDG